MIQFASEFSDFEILPPLAAKLSWSHFLLLIPLKSIESKIYYATERLLILSQMIDMKMVCKSDPSLMS